MDRLSQKVAEAVTHAWYSNHGGNRMEVPTGVVAMLALAGRYNPETLDDVEAAWRRMTLESFHANAKSIWCAGWVLEPYLITVAKPIYMWLWEDPADSTLKAARAVALAAIDAGLFTIVGHTDPRLRLEEDVLGSVVTELRTNGARQGLGEYHTPPDITELLTAMIMVHAAPEVGDAVHEPAVGTGGMFRAKAVELWEHDIDPAQLRWDAVEVDAVSASCAAVNAIIWALGPHVTIWNGDSLAEGDAHHKAVEMRRGVHGEHRFAAQALGFARAVAESDRVLRMLTGDEVEEAV